MKTNQPISPALRVVRLHLTIILGLIVTGFSSIATLRATDYYVDPATGNMSNPGTSALPWSTLEAVFTANKTFVAGDTLRLRNGYHGAPSVKGNNSGIVTIQPDTGAVPKLKKLTFKSGSQWVATDLDICPQNAGAGIYDTGSLVDVQSTCSYITVKNCLIRPASDITGWTVTDWQTKLTKTSNAINVNAAHSTILDNDVFNASFGIVLGKTAVFSLVSGNTITNFYNDAMRGLADDCVFEYNLVQNSYVADSNHDDFFQSWSTDAAGTVGAGTVYRVTLRGNTFLGYTDPAQPLVAQPQGAGLFDGMFQDWVVENNVIASKTYHGISFYGAINCKIINNTVIENPLDVSSSLRPWILVTSHKDQANGTPWPVPSSGNIVRNNITAKGATVIAGGGVADHNVNTTAYTTYFKDYVNFNFDLSATSPARDTGLDTDAPTIDILGRTRTTPFDIGAYEYQATFSGLMGGGEGHSVVLQFNGTVWSWGRNEYGQLGTGNTTNTNAPVQVTGLTGVKAIAVGGQHAIALKTDGTVWGWGRNDFGQLGNGTTTNSSVPAQVSGLTSVASVYSGEQHNFALKTDGTLWTWGQGTYGQLGLGVSGNKTTPQQITTLTSVVSLAGGRTHSLAVKSDGTVWAWGGNSLGELGDGTTTGHNAPIQVTSLSNVVSVGTGGFHSGAVTSSGTVYMWGSNSNGQIGDGTLINKLSPVAISGFADAKKMVGGLYYTKLLTATGNVWGWGSNAQGQLGDNTTVDKSTPVQITSLTGVVDIASGLYHGFQVKPDGSLYMVGYNYRGQIGDGTNTTRKTPVLISGIDLIAP